jgi:ABC-type uncharacterized transport system substrate-binding protein
MRRRDLLSGAAGAIIAASCRDGRAAEPSHMGFISGGDANSAADFLRAMRDGLADEGYREPETMRLELRFADWSLDRVPELVQELEDRKVQLIITHAAATPIIVKGYRTVPVVYEFSADPIATGIAADLAHPLFNATGITLMKAELNSKRLQFLHEIAPDVHRVAVIANPLHPGEERERQDLEAEAERLGVHLDFHLTPTRTELDRALDAIREHPPQAIMAFSDGFVVENRKAIIELANTLHLPVASGWAVMAKSGALLTYGPKLVESYRRTAYFISRILKGATASELPIERPTVLELVVNRASANKLGLTIPPTLLARADEVIE